MKRRCLCLCGLLLASGVLPSGCDSPIVKDSMRNRADRMEKCAAPVAKGAVIDLQDNNGSVVVTGGTGTQCEVTVGITVQAATQREAQELAGKVKIVINNTHDGVQIRSEVPFTMTGQTISISYEVAIPRECVFTAKLHNGALTASGLAGPLKLTCSNGNITVRDCTAAVTARSDNGSINCSGLRGACDLKSGNGAVAAAYAPNAPAAATIKMSTTNGGIELSPPPKLSAAVDLSARNGVIRCSWPTKIGFFDRHQHGTLGKGEGKVSLSTDNGSIVVRDP